ncbi:hypothetical protein D3C71_1145080 [compost metagenome]
MSEITVDKILGGVILALSNLFPGRDVYAEKIPQGFEAPCFFVKLLTGSQGKELGRRFRRSHAFDIHFFPVGQDYNKEGHRMADRLYEGLLSIPIEGALYRVTNTSHEVVDDVLHFFCDINYRVVAEAPRYPKMKTLTEEGFIRDGK